MNPSDDLVQQILDNETLTRILESHALNLETSGREGQEADLSRYVISDFDFSGLDLSSIHIYGTTFHRCRFQRTDLYGVVFSEASAPSGDFREAVLAKAEFHGADLQGANFDGANLIRALFLGCNLRAATFQGANLASTSLSGSDVAGALFDEPIRVG